MSAIGFKKVIFTLVLGGCAGYALSVMVKTTGLQNSPAARAPANAKLLGKHARSLDLDVSGYTKEDLTGELSAHLMIHKSHASQLKYTWVLPEKAVAEPTEVLSGVITDVHPGAFHTVNLKLLRFEGGQVFFRAYFVQADGTEIGETGAFTPLLLKPAEESNPSPSN